MWFLFVPLILFAFIFLPTLRCAVFNLYQVSKYSVRDTINYYRQKKYNLYSTGELVAYTGLFGKGKTLSVVHRVVGAYEKYNDKLVWCPQRKKIVTQKIHVISNVSLSIPYEHFHSLDQLVYATTDEFKAQDELNDTLTVTLVLGDEFSVMMNSRDYKTNINSLLLNSILTCRHHHISLYYTAQRFAHVDALLRQVTSSVIECNKLWRLQRLAHFDAWDMENATTASVLKPYRRSCWFVRDKDYNAYDTYACVAQLVRASKEGKLYTDSEILELTRPGTPNMDAVYKPSKKWLRRNKR